MRASLHAAQIRPMAIVLQPLVTLLRPQATQRKVGSVTPAIEAWRSVVSRKQCSSMG
jgi:hypothetical protein